MPDCSFENVKYLVLFTLISSELILLGDTCSCHLRCFPALPCIYLTYLTCSCFPRSCFIRFFFQLLNGSCFLFILSLKFLLMLHLFLYSSFLFNSSFLNSSCFSISSSKFLLIFCTCFIYSCFHRSCSFVFFHFSTVPVFHPDIKVPA